MAATPFLYLCALTGNHQNDKDIGKVTPCQRHQLINGNSFDQLVAKLKKILFANFLTNIFFSDSLLIPFYIHNKLYCHIYYFLHLYHLCAIMDSELRKAR